MQEKIITIFSYICQIVRFSFALSVIDSLIRYAGMTGYWRTWGVSVILGFALESSAGWSARQVAKDIRDSAERLEIKFKEFAANVSPKEW